MLWNVVQHLRETRVHLIECLFEQRPAAGRVEACAGDVELHQLLIELALHGEVEGFVDAQGTDYVGFRERATLHADALSVSVPVAMALRALLWSRGEAIGGLLLLLLLRLLLSLRRMHPIRQAWGKAMMMLRVLLRLTGVGIVKRESRRFTGVDGSKTSGVLVAFVEMFLTSFGVAGGLLLAAVVAAHCAILAVGAGHFCEVFADGVAGPTVGEEEVVRSIQYRMSGNVVIGYTYGIIVGFSQVYNCYQMGPWSLSTISVGFPPK